jgi:hypothetical protein
LQIAPVILLRAFSLPSGATIAVGGIGFFGRFIIDFAGLWLVGAVGIEPTTSPV